MRRLKTIVAGVALAALACESAPTGEVAPAWRLVATPPPGYDRFLLAAAGADGVHVVAGKGAEGITIFKYDGSSLIEEYIVPPEREIELTDMAFAGGKGWVVGTERNEESPPPFKPYCLAYDGATWRELDLPDELGRINAIAPVNETAFWFLADADGATGGGAAGKYEGGVVTSYTANGFMQGISYSAADSCVYAVKSSSHNRAVFVSGNGGASWTREAVDVNAFGYELQYLKGCGSRPGELYVIGNYVGEGWGLIRREGTPGQGEYSLAFMDVVDPVLDNIGALAFDARGRGVAVGGDAALYFDGETWVKEETTEPVYFASVRPAPGGGFWAVATQGDIFGPGPEQAGLFYHP